MKQLCILTFFIMSYSIWAQVGIGTNSPDATLDINGTVRITNIPTITVPEISQALGGITTAEKLNRTELGINIYISNEDGLITAPVARETGSRVIVPIDYSSGIRIDDLNIYLGADEINERATFIYISGYNSTTKLGGISGGSHGRRISFYFSESATFNLLDDDSNSLPKNRFFTLTGAQLGVSGNGLVEMVYDENDGSDGLGRWVIIKHRN